MVGWYDLRWAGEGRRLQGELLRRQRDLRPGEPANIQFTSGVCAGLPSFIDSIDVVAPHVALQLTHRLPPPPALPTCLGCSGGAPIAAAATAAGTTGFPKAATLSHHGILNNGLLVGAACRYTEADRQGSCQQGRPRQVQ